MYENYNKMKTRSQTREPRFPEPLLKKMGVPLPLLLHSGEGAAARSNRWGALRGPEGNPRGLEQLINFPPVSLIFTLEYR